MPNFLYRFRSIEKLLGKEYEELEKQEIYFSLPEHLNDPLEGYKDIFWQGDHIVWKNFFKHYLLCLERICTIFSLADNEHLITENEIPIFENPNNLPDIPHKKVYQDIFDLFFETDVIKTLPTWLSSLHNPIRRNNLFFYLKVIHLHAVNIIFQVHANHGLIPKNPEYDQAYSLSKERLGNLEMLKKLPNCPPEIEEAINLTNESILMQLDLIFRINNQLSKLNAKIGDKNKDFLLVDFPNKYLEQIEKLLHPQWYTACFMDNCQNTSIWGHYGDNHKGICLKFKVKNSNNDSFMSLNGIRGVRTNNGKSEYFNDWMDIKFRKVTYNLKYPEIDFFRSMGQLSKSNLELWYKDDNNDISTCSDSVFKEHQKWIDNHWSNHYKIITTKNEDWKYECEYRLTVEQTAIDYTDPKNRILKYKFSDLDGIIFGIKTLESDKLEIIRIIQAKCKKENRKDFNFYQAYYSHKSGKIETHKMDLIKFT